MLWRERFYFLSFYPQAHLQRKAYQGIFLSFLICVFGGGFAFHAAHADERDKVVMNGASYLSPNMLDQLYDHPTLRQSGARSCRAIFILGQRRAEQKVDVSASLSGERQLASNFKTSSRDPISAQERGYDRSYDNVYDLELAARYRLYDWGVGAARVRSETQRLAAERLNHNVNLTNVVQDILRVLMQIENARQEAVYREQALKEIAPHVTAIEAQGKAGSIGLAQVRETKLSVLNAEIALQRVQRRVDESLKELQSSFKMTYEDARPLLDAFLTSRTDEILEIDTQDWTLIRVLDARIAGQKDDLLAIENERYPRIDSVLEATVFDATDFESEYQLVGRLEFSLPLYDGGSNKARQQEKSWQVSELTHQREEQLRIHQTDTQQGKIVLRRRALEIETMKEQLADIEGRYQSLNALVGNSLVSRQQIIQLLGERTQKMIELSQLEWQQEFAYVRMHTLANNLTPLLGIHLGDNQC